MQKAGASVAVRRELSTRDGPASGAKFDDPDGRWWRNTDHAGKGLRGTSWGGMIRIGWESIMRIGMRGR